MLHTVNMADHRLLPSSPGWAADVSEGWSGAASSSPPAAPSSSPPQTPTKGSLYTSDSVSRSAMQQVTPGSFASPRTSKLYPIPSATADVLEARRAAFFRDRSSATRSSGAATPQHVAQGAPAGSAGRLSRFKQPPSALISGAITSTSSGTEDMDTTARLYRQRFKARCQAVLARERGRRKALDKARGKDVLSMDANDLDFDGAVHTDDLSSSDAIDTEIDDWQYQDEELVRRVMLAEYRRLLHSQEASGRREVGWLGDEEVAWLEDELHRDNAVRGHGAELQPPADILDEEAWLYEQYANAFGQRQDQTAHADDDDFDIAGAFWDDEALQRIESEAERQATQSSQAQDRFGEMDTS
ncbi:unnamed protein product [Parajaminaea phylloscopi]